VFWCILALFLVTEYRLLRCTCPQCPLWLRQWLLAADTWHGR